MILKAILLNINVYLQSYSEQKLFRTKLLLSIVSFSHLIYTMPVGVLVEYLWNYSRGWVSLVFFKMLPKGS